MGWKIPIRGHDGIAFDVDTFGFGLLAHAVQGGFVLLFLEWACHLEGGSAVDGIRIVVRETRLGIDKPF